MKKNLLITTLLLTIISIHAVPPHPDLVQEYKDRGELPLLSSRMAAGAHMGKNLLERSFPLSGDRKVLVLLVGYSVNDLNVLSTPTFYDDLFTTGPGGNGLSWRAYYQDMSNGQLNLDFDVYDVGQSSQTYDYYGAGAGTNDAYAGQLVAEAVKAGDANGIDYSQYDNDGDGYVDAVIVIHQGAGAEISGNDDHIWSHRWSLEAANDDDHSGAGWDVTLPGGASVDGSNSGILVYDNVKINDYAIQPEYLVAPGDSTIGVFVHEFGHVLGLPDLYDTSYSSDGIGDWGIMAGGSWSGPDGKGSRPAPLSAWSRLYLGWLTVDVIKESGKMILGAPFSGNGIAKKLLIISISALLIMLIMERRKVISLKKPALIPVVLICTILFATCGEKDTLTNESLTDVETSFEGKVIDLGSGEYILMENKVRKDETWSEYLPGSGLILYHVDNNLINTRFSSNRINDYSINATLGVKVIEADNGSDLIDGSDGDYGTYTDAFSIRNRHTLSEYPSNSGIVSNFEINNISDAGNIMTFNLFIEN